MNPLPVERADTRPIDLPRMRRRVSWWHPVCISLALIGVGLMGWAVTL